MKPLQIKVLSFDEAKFEYNEKIGELSQEILSDIRIIFDPILSYREGINTVGLQLTVNYLFKSTPILSYGVSMTVAIDEYIQAQAKGTTIEEFMKDEEIRVQLFDLVKGFLRGCMAIRAKHTPVAKLFLPVFDSSNMAKQIKIMQQ